MRSLCCHLGYISKQDRREEKKVRRTDKKGKKKRKGSANKYKLYTNSVK
jgi:hypothetical protein